MFKVTDKTDVKIFTNLPAIENDLKNFIKENIGTNILEILQNHSEDQNGFTFLMTIIYEKNK